MFHLIFNFFSLFFSRSVRARAITGFATCVASSMPHVTRVVQDMMTPSMSATTARPTVTRVVPTPEAQRIETGMIKINFILPHCYSSGRLWHYVSTKFLYSQTLLRNPLELVVLIIPQNQQRHQEKAWWQYNIVRHRKNRRYLLFCIMLRAVTFNSMYMNNAVNVKRNNELFSLCLLNAHPFVKLFKST